MDKLILANRIIDPERHYILRFKSGTKYWLSFSLSRLNKYISEFGEDFNLVIAGSDLALDDFFLIPYAIGKHMLIDKYMQKGSKRWIGDVYNSKFKIRNCKLPLDVTEYYGDPYVVVYPNEVTEIASLEENEYAIQNLKREIYVRQRQSIFRNKVVDNFGSLVFPVITFNYL